MKRMSACGMVLMSVFACMANAPVVFAQYSGGYSGGQWVGPYFSATGSTHAAISTHSVADRDTQFIFSSWGPYLTLGAPYPLPGYYYASLNGDQCIVTDGSGTYNVTYIYQNYYTGQPSTPPFLQRKVYLKETSSVSWMASGSGWQNNTPYLIKGDGEANNGRKDPVVLNADQTGGTSSGVHLLQQDGSSGLVTFTVSPSASAKLNLFGILAGSGAAGNMFNYAWELDTRSVTIFCDALEGGNCRKGANDLPELNRRNDDGSMTVDTIPTIINNKDDWRFEQLVQANTTGFDVTSSSFYELTNTKIDWSGNSSSGDMTSVTGTYDSNGVDAKAFTRGNDKQLPATFNIHVKVKDLRPNLAATAENDYTIRIHAPFENGVETAARKFDHNEKYAWSIVVDANTSATVNMVTQQPRQWSLSGQSLNIIGSVLAGVCGSGLVVLLAPDCPPAAAVVADMVFNVVGWAVSNAGSPEPIATDTVKANRDAFTKAVTEQGIINTRWGDPNLNDLVDCPEDTRIICGDSLPKVMADQQWYWNFGTPKGRCHKGERYIKCTVTGDGYGTYGYMGRQTNYPVIPDRKLDDIWEWTVSSKPVL